MENGMRLRSTFMKHSVRSRLLRLADVDVMGATVEVEFPSSQLPTLAHAVRNYTA